MTTGFSPGGIAAAPVYFFIFLFSLLLLFLCGAVPTVAGGGLREKKRGTDRPRETDGEVNVNAAVARNGDGKHKQDGGGDMGKR